MKPTLVLVRHGETEGQSSIRYHGRTDVALSDLGRAQMRAARDAIAKRRISLSFDHVFTSPLVRATEGARIIAGEPARLSILDDFAEVHFGLFEGLTAGEIRERYPDDYARWNADRLAPDYTYPGGESRAAFADRVGRGVDQMIARWAPDAGAASHALLVAHRGVIRTIVTRLTGHQPVVDLGSIQIVEFDGAWRVALLDHVDHLKDLYGM
ncbi:MAG: histidine phosphatase family protein [Candidatus Binataceae bacterium]